MEIVINFYAYDDFEINKYLQSRYLVGCRETMVPLTIHK